MKFIHYCKNKSILASLGSGLTFCTAVLWRSKFLHKKSSLELIWVPPTHFPRWKLHEKFRNMACIELVENENVTSLVSISVIVKYRRLLRAVLFFIIWANYHLSVRIVSHFILNRLRNLFEWILTDTEVWWHYWVDITIKENPYNNKKKRRFRNISTWRTDIEILTNFIIFQFFCLRFL